MLSMGICHDGHRSLSWLAGKPGRRKGDKRGGTFVFSTGNGNGGVSWSAAHTRFADTFQSVLPKSRSAARERETRLSSRVLAYLAKGTSRWVWYHAFSWLCTD